MVVKETRGRRRYVAFTLGRSVPKPELEDALASASCGQLRVIQCAGGWCIVRCEPWQIQSVRDIVTKAFPGSESVSTSGNLIKLRRRYPILWDTRPRYIAFTVSLGEEELSDAIRERSNDDGPSLKFCKSGYAIVKCTLRDSDRTIEIMKDIDPSSNAFSSSYKSSELKRAISCREPSMRAILFARK